MMTQRVELLRDTLVNGKPVLKGAVISVDGHMYNYLDNCLCIKDAEPEVEPVKPAQNKATAKK